MQRRTLFQIGAATASLMAIAAAGVALTGPALRDARLTPIGQSVFAAVARAVLEGSLPTGSDATVTMRAHLLRLDATIEGFAPAVQQEIQQLATLLAHAPTRMALVGLARDWPAASTAELRDMLQALRVSAWPLRQQIYHALRDLTNAAFYADPASWPAIGYPGPPSISASALR